MPSTTTLVDQDAADAIIEKDVEARSSLRSQGRVIILFLHVLCEGVFQKARELTSDAVACNTNARDLTSLLRQGHP
jgi:hypothetical protein